MSIFFNVCGSGRCTCTPSAICQSSQYTVTLNRTACMQYPKQIEKYSLLSNHFYYLSLLFLHRRLRDKQICHPLGPCVKAQLSIFIMFYSFHLLFIIWIEHQKLQFRVRSLEENLQLLVLIILYFQPCNVSVYHLVITSAYTQLHHLRVKRKMMLKLKVMLAVYSKDLTINFFIR